MPRGVPWRSAKPQFKVRVSGQVSRGVRRGLNPVDLSTSLCVNAGDRCDDRPKCW